MTLLDQAVMQLLEKQNRMAVARLAKELAQPQSAIIRAATGLEEAGLVVRDGNYVCRT